MICKTNMLTVEVTFEITVGFKIFVWMKPETVFTKRDGNLVKNRHFRVPCERHGCDMISNAINRFVFRPVKVDEFVNWSTFHIRQVLLNSSRWDESLNNSSLMSGKKYKPWNENQNETSENNETGSKTYTKLTVPWCRKNYKPKNDNQKKTSKRVKPEVVKQIQS